MNVGLNEKMWTSIKVTMTMTVGLNGKMWTSLINLRALVRIKMLSCPEKLIGWPFFAYIIFVQCRLL